MWFCYIQTNKMPTYEALFYLILYNDKITFVTLSTLFIVVNFSVTFIKLISYKLNKSYSNKHPKLLVLLNIMICGQQ